jgi:hypothetical protein
MNILIIAYYAHPDNNGGVKRPAAFASGLEKYGHKVTILTHGDSKKYRKGNIYRIKNLYDRNGLFGRSKIFIHKVKRKISLLLGFYDTYYSDWKREVIKHSDEIIAKTNPEVIIASYLIGKGFDLVAAITGKRFAISSIRVKKFCANSVYNTAIDKTGFVPPVPLEQALSQTVLYEFVESHEHEGVFYTE